jgi:hypothetical protein
MKEHPTHIFAATAALPLPPSSQAGVKKKQEAEAKKREAKIEAVREEKKRLKAEKAAQQAARLAAVKEHINQQRSKRAMWEERQRKQKADQGKATAQYRGAKIKSLQTLAEQRRREAEERVAAKRKEIAESEKKAKEAFKVQRQKEIAEVRQQEIDFRKVGRRG